jgi:hypothetical protein
MKFAEYKTFVANVENFLKVNNVKAGCHSPKDSEAESFFSWSQCECCKSTLGGNRETYTFAQTDNKTFEADICTDCVYFLAYGKLDDVTMAQVMANQIEVEHEQRCAREREWERAEAKREIARLEQEIAEWRKKL